jgi:hypothetical protein
MLGVMYEVRTFLSPKSLSHQAAEMITAEFIALTIDVSPFHLTIDIFRDKNN